MAAVFQQRQHFQFNKHGRRLVDGKALDEDLREPIVLSLLKEGADVATGKVPYGKIKQTAERCMVGSDTVAILWKRYIEDRALNLNRQVVVFQNLENRRSTLSST